MCEVTGKERAHEDLRPTRLFPGALMGAGRWSDVRDLHQELDTVSLACRIRCEPLDVGLGLVREEGAKDLREVRIVELDDVQTPRRLWDRDAADDICRFPVPAGGVETDDEFELQLRNRREGMMGGDGGSDLRHDVDRAEHNRVQVTIPDELVLVSQNMLYDVIHDRRQADRDHEMV